MVMINCGSAGGGGASAEPEFRSGTETTTHELRDCCRWTPPPNDNRDGCRREPPASSSSSSSAAFAMAFMTGFVRGWHSSFREHFRRHEAQQQQQHRATMPVMIAHSTPTRQRCQEAYGSTCIVHPMPSNGRRYGDSRQRSALVPCVALRSVALTACTRFPPGMAPCVRGPNGVACERTGERSGMCDVRRPLGLDEY